MSIDKSKKTLLFVTYQYPYLSGEYFIEEEMKYLIEAFDDVVVLPARCFFWKPNLGVRELPKGAVLWDPRKVPLIKRMTWALLACLQAPAYLKEQKVAWQGNAGLPNVSYLKALKTAVKAILVGHAISWFGRRSNLPDDRIGYAYWRDFSAAALALSRDALGLKKLYARCHRVDIYSPFRWPNETIIHAKVDGIFPVSTDGKRFLEESKGLSADNIEVRRLGVRIPNQCSERSTDGIYRVVSCSNIVPVKRVELIAKVIAGLPFPVEWTHIGDGPESDLVKQVTDEFDSDHEVIYKGRLSNQEVYQYYGSARVDLFINLSESEGVPVSIMEAMAHGIPSVATDVGGTAEIVNDTNGAVVSVDASLDEVRAAIQRVSDNSMAPERARVQAELMCCAERNYLEFCELLCQ